MNSHQKTVHDHRTRFLLDCPKKPTMPEWAKRWREWHTANTAHEPLFLAMLDGKLPEAAHGVALMYWQVLSLACSIGVDVEPIFELVAAAKTEAEASNSPYETPDLSGLI